MRVPPRSNGFTQKHISHSIIFVGFSGIHTHGISDGVRVSPGYSIWKDEVADIFRPMLKVELDPVISRKPTRYCVGLAFAT